MATASSRTSISTPLTPGRSSSRTSRLQYELEAIARAERRVDEGTYGVSVDSGQPIPDGRLEAIPWAERTAEEQSRFEAGSA